VSSICGYFVFGLMVIFEESVFFNCSGKALPWMGIGATSPTHDFC
jgi:hypothetical protein